MFFSWVFVVLIGIILQATFIGMEYLKKPIAAVIFKGLASCMFITLGVIFSRFCSDAGFAKLIVVGLFFGGVGDILLNLRFVFESIGQKIFLAGIAAFLIGHIIYFAALVTKTSYLPASIIVGAVLTALLLKWMFGRIEAPKAFKIFGVLYIGAIVLMTVTAASILLTNAGSGNVMYFIGALAFLISDIVLIFNTFGKNQKFSLRIANLSFYYVGQLLIAMSLMLL